VPVLISLSLPFLFLAFLALSTCDFPFLPQHHPVSAA